MTSIDANLLLFSYSTDSPFHEKARRFLQSIGQREDIGISEFVLAEFYLHLRNPAVLVRPLSASEAAEVIQSYRRHPRWQTFGFPPHSRKLHDTLWHDAAKPNFARRRIYDSRTALTLRAFGVTHFATANVKDFQGFGFERVWNPLIDSKN
ncbi:MAG TPA: VapC toxin family PIN domain ribonuclease [Chthoniobacterales bacterium]